MNVTLYFIILIVELFVLIGASLYGAGLLFSAFKGAPYVPTSKKHLEAILGNLHMKTDDTFIELGSGDGRMLRLASKKYGVRGVGVEINLLLVWLSRFLSRLDGTSEKVLFVHKNVFDYSLTKVDYLYLFLMPELIKKMIPKFNEELQKGSTIISHGFKIDEYTKKLIYTQKENTFSTFYYKM